MHTIKIKVRGYHLDMYRHVNNARFLEFLEEARWNFVEAKLDLQDWFKKGLGFAVVNINIHYRKPALLNQILNIKSEISHISTKSATIKQQIFINSTDILIADAKVTFVIVDIKTGKAVPLEGEIREILKSL
jgi:thioesterase-3